MKKKIIVAILVLSLFLLTGCSDLLEQMQSRQPLPSVNKTTGEETVTISKAEYDYLQETADKFSEIEYMRNIVNHQFYEETDEQQMIYGANKGYLAALGDPYTFYYTPEEFARMWEDDKGEYTGVGMMISSSYETLKSTVSRVFRDTPAQRAGVHKNDQLIRVEDLEVNAYTINEAVSIMRGKVGETVEIEVKRGEEQIVFKLTREDIKVNSEEYMMLTDEVGYIALYDFSSNSYNAFKTALTALQKQGAKGLIVDLRDNPGGWLTDALAIADEFIEGEEIITYTQARDGTKDISYATKGALTMPMVVLVNEHSASASELLSGALKDYKLATIMGVNTFGKGIVQSVFPLMEGAGMQLTTAQYFTPLGNPVHEKGIAPDIEVPLPEGDVGMYAFGDLADPQLKAALEETQRQLAQEK